MPSRCRDSNPRPLDHGSSPITTRPGLPPILKFVYDISSRVGGMISNNLKVNIFFCVSSLRRGHPNLLCIVPILVYVLPCRATQQVPVYKCKGCKEEGRRKGEYLGYLHDTGSNPVSVEQTLRVSSDLKIIKPSNLMCFIETYREGITKISNKICSQKVTLIATRVPKILNLQG